MTNDDLLSYVPAVPERLLRSFAKRMGIMHDTKMSALSYALMEARGASRSLDAILARAAEIEGVLAGFSGGPGRLDLYMGLALEIDADANIEDRVGIANSLWHFTSGSASPQGSPQESERSPSAPRRPAPQAPSSGAMDH